MADQRHGIYYGPKVVPCECGSTEAYWHGPEGLRTYSCNRCAAPCLVCGEPGCEGRCIDGPMDDGEETTT